MNPVLSVTVSTQVSGTIKDLAVDVNSRVKVGQLIAILDQDLFRAEVLQAEAKVEDALANLAKEKAGVKMQKDQIAASIAETKASYENLEEKYKRASELFRRDLISKEAYDGVKAEWEMAASRFKESSARVDETKVKQANIQAAEAKVKIARATLELAQVKAKRSVIRAPVSGIVIAKNVEAGQTVAASLSSPPIVTIAELTKMKVDAWVDEADIGNVREGQKVQFQVDAYPARIFRGEVVKIYPSPQIQN
ncbi:MAG: HlyD family secretion protein, partial [Deltaproteobacteria bacterium]|nr:HlyD family secretion protein [Deltaproteobacteria bacterium]